MLWFYLTEWPFRQREQMCNGPEAENPGRIQGKARSPLQPEQSEKGRTKGGKVREVTGPDCGGSQKPLVFTNSEIRIYWMILSKGLTLPDLLFNRITLMALLEIDRRIKSRSRWNQSQPMGNSDHQIYTIVTEDSVFTEAKSKQQFSPFRNIFDEREDITIITQQIFSSF